MGLKYNFIEGQTILEEEEMEGLLIKTINTRSELDEFEQQNIEKAIEWTYKNKFKPEELLTDFFVRKVHFKMFGNVWKWAGKYRRTNKNIGVEKHSIAVSLRKSLDDTKYYIKHDTYPPKLIAVMLKFHIVRIHPFANGNGRLSRLMADILLQNVFDEKPFTWGRDNLSEQGKARQIYLKAIYAADQGDFMPLLEFAQS